MLFALGSIHIEHPYKTQTTKRRDAAPHIIHASFVLVTEIKFDNIFR